MNKYYLSELNIWGFIVVIIPLTTSIVGFVNQYLLGNTAYNNLLL